MNRLKEQLGVISLLLSLVAMLSTFAVIPYRLSAAERRIEQLYLRYESDHDLLVKINTKLEAITERLGIQEGKK